MSTPEAPLLANPDLLINQVRQASPQIATSLDALCLDDLRALSERLTPCYIVPAGYLLSNASDEVLTTCATLLLNAAHSITAAVELLRSGYSLQPGILIRSVIVTLSTALHLKLHPEDLPGFQGGRLKDTDTLDAAKLVIPRFGRDYGFFSAEFAHLGQVHRTLHHLLPYEARGPFLEMNLFFLRWITWLHYVTTEFIFLAVVPERRYWRMVSPTRIEYAPSSAECTWMDRWLAVPTRDTADGRTN